MGRFARGVDCLRSGSWLLGLSLFAAVPCSAALYPYKTMAIGSSSVSVVAIGDLNGDGRADLAAATRSGGDPLNDQCVFVFLQTAQGTLVPPVRYPTGLDATGIAIGDVNSDGLADLAVCGGNGVALLRQKADHTLAPVRFIATGAGAESVKIGDLNGDGRADLAVSHGDEPQISVLYQTTVGTFFPPHRYPVRDPGYGELGIGDVNGDGLPDLVYLRGHLDYGTLSVLLQDPGTHLLKSPVGYGWGDRRTAHGLALGDFNGDGHTDVAVTWGGYQPDCGLGIFNQAWNGALDHPITLDSSDVPEPIEAADMNGDGLADLVVAHGSWQNLGIFTQQPDGTFAPEELFPLPYASHYQPQGLALGDLNGDGTPDVALADGTDGLVLLYNAGSRDITPPSTAILHGPPAYSRSTSVSFQYQGLDETTPAADLQYSWNVDGAAWSPFTPATTALPGGLAEGWHTFSVAARDAAGNVDPHPPAYRFAVDLTPPDSLSITGVTPYTSAQGVILRALAVDNLAETGELLFSWRVDGGPWSDFSAAIKLTLYGLFEGAHMIDVRAEDPAGNVSTGIASAPFVVDRTPPNTRIDGVTRDLLAGSAKVSFSGTDNIPLPNRLSFSWRVDGGAWSPFSTSTQSALSGLTAGPHTFEVRARDSAGNIDPTPAAQGL